MARKTEPSLRAVVTADEHDKFRTEKTILSTITTCMSVPCFRDVARDWWKIVNFTYTALVFGVPVRGHPLEFRQNV